MSVGYPGVPTALAGTFVELAKAVQKIAVAVNSLRAGKVNSVDSVSLTANAASTTIMKQEFGAGTHYSFTALTANAAAEHGGTAMFVSARGKGTMTITHANNAQTDRTFSYSYTG